MGNTPYTQESEFLSCIDESKDGVQPMYDGTNNGMNQNDLQMLVGTMEEFDKNYSKVFEEMLKNSEENFVFAMGRKLTTKLKSHRNT